MCILRENKVCKEKVEMAAFLREFKKYYMWTVFLQNPDNEVCHGDVERLMLPLLPPNAPPCQ